MALELILILDTELPDPFGIVGSKDFYDTSLYLKSNNKLLSLSIRNWAKYCRATNTKFPESVRQSMGDIDLIIAEFDNQIGKKNRRNLLEADSKLNLNILLNSPGGHNVALRAISDIIEFIKSKNGTINSFSFVSVASAASHIFSYTDNRYCLKLSEFMCHTSVTVPELEQMFEDRTSEEKEIAEEIKYDDYKEHLEKFFDRHHPDKSGRIKEIVDKALEKHNCELYVGGYNLETWGVVDRAFYDFGELRNIMIEKIGKKSLQHYRIRAFVDQMEKEYSVVLDDNNKYTQKLPALKCPND